MSVEKLRPEQAPDLTKYSTAALLVVKSRFEQGNGSPYDGFLCSHIGDPRQSNVPPVFQIAPEGAIYAYNSPFAGQVRRSYSREGHLVNIRHVQGMPEQGDELYGFYVASVDLRTGDTVEWQVTDVQHFGSFGSRRTVIELSDRPRLSLLNRDESGFSTLETEIARRLRRGSSAQVVMDTEYGCSFQAGGGVAEKLHDVTGLVDEVNALTDSYGLTAELDTRRQRVGNQLGTVVPLSVLAA